MHFADQPVRYREPVPDPRESMLQCRDVVRHLDDVIERHTGQRFDLEQQQIGEAQIGQEPPRPHEALQVRNARTVERAVLAGEVGDAGHDTMLRPGVLCGDHQR